MIQDFVTFSYNLYQEKPININDNDKEIRLNIRRKSSEKETEVRSNIGYLNFKYDPDLIEKRKQKIIEFFRLHNENEINENIIPKLYDNFTKIGKMLD